MLVPSRYVASNLNYSKSLSNDKWFIAINNRSNTNIEADTILTKIYDIRGQEARSNINTIGFQALTSPSSVPGDLLLSSTTDAIAHYYTEVEALIKRVTAASNVVIFDHTVRATREPKLEDVPGQRRPVQRVHVDQTPRSAHEYIQRYVHPPLSSHYKRFMIINVWRPILNKVYDFPLAMCAFNTVNVEEDLIPTTVLYDTPNANDECYSMKYNNKHTWWYWSGMTPDEVLFLKCYDSACSELKPCSAHDGAEMDGVEMGGIAGLAPHTAFFDQEGSKMGIGRQSIEVRTLVFYV
jgi:cephamycin C biosynthesis protein